MLTAVSAAYRRRIFRTVLLALVTGALLSCLATASSSAQAIGQDSSSPSAKAQAAVPAQPKPAPVTTTVVVHSETEDNYLPESVTVGTLDGGSLLETPVSASVVTHELISNQVSRLLSDVVQNDASVNNDYVPVGYYGVYEIRGFPIDLATGLEIDGMTIAGEQDVPLENKESVEILKGVAGVESGVANAGGLIDYVTKRPIDVGAVDFASDQRGTAYGATDLGHLFGSRKQVGARVNLAGERIVPYMNDTEGWRAVGAGAADWKIGNATTLKGNFEYQHKTERDGSGYQLLGGTMLPDINRIYRSTMLGDQPWGLPDTYDTFNTNMRIDRTLSANWLAFGSLSLSHSLIQDNVLYVYGCYYEAECNSGSTPYPWFFSPDGTYDVYDYRNPNELRIDGEAEAMLSGHFRTGVVTQDITAGGVVFLRSVQEPGYYQLNQTSTNTISDGAVYTYIGSENIYQPIAPVAAPGTSNSLEPTYETAGPRRLYVDSHQASAVIQDRVHLPGRIQIMVGGRYDSLRDHNYSAHATDPSAPMNPTDQAVWLPQYAVTFNPIKNLTLYSNYGVLLSLGPQGPFWTDNGSQFLNPFFTRQAEVGAKYEPGQRILLTTAFFHMRAPFFYPKLITAPDTTCGVDEFDPNSTSNLCFEQAGRETHNGVEVNAAGKAVDWLRLNASAAAIQAISTNTGTPTFDNKQVINVPHLHTNVFADVTVPHMHGLHLMPGWSFTTRKEATRDDQVSVPSYNLFNLGARYTPGGEQGRVTFHVYADNIANHRYWSDTGASYGDTFLWLGAPTTVRLSAHYRF